MLIAPALAFALTLGYAALVQPAWEPQHTDQLQYLALARGLAERGEFTRATGAEAFFPETYRLPGYPLLLAPLCIGGCDHWRIAIAQAFLVAMLAFLAGALTSRIAPRAATAAAIATALFLPFAYYGAIALSDLPGAAVFGLGILMWVRSLERRSAFLAVAAGALFGWAGLMRGALVFAPLVFAGAAMLRDRANARVAAASVLATLIVLAPYVAYSEVGFGRVTGGTSGLVTWLGVFQGRTEASLDVFERAQADEARADIAAFDAIADRTARALAWPPLDDSLGARARALIAHDPIGWVARAVPRALELWAGERPVPGGASGDLALALAAVQVVFVIVAFAGVVVLARRGDQTATVVVLAIVYVTVTALPFQTEARYALPAKMLAVVAAVAFIDSRVAARRSLPVSRI